MLICKGKVAIRSIPLYRHPNTKKNGQFYVIPRNYLIAQILLTKQFIHGNGIKTIREK